MKTFKASIPFTTQVHWHESVPALLDRVAQLDYLRMMWIIDSKVYALYHDVLHDIVFDQGAKHFFVIVESGETRKSIDEALRLYGHLAEQEWTKADALVALGGGMIGDLAGYVAGTYLRGLPLEFIPTTVLSQVDSSIGGKVAINTSWAKNQLGLYYPARNIWMTIDFLKTLDPQDYESGLGELLKVIFLSDATKTHQLLALDRAGFEAHLNSWMSEALDYKIEVCSRDFLDQNERLLLNFGHSIGHAIEAELGYANISHGLAVAMGIELLTSFFEAIGRTKEGTTREIKQIYHQLGLAFPVLKKSQIAAICKRMEYDKKRAGNSLTLVGIETFGVPFRQTFPIEIIEDIKLFLEAKDEIID